MAMTFQDIMTFVRPEVFILIPVIWYIGSVLKKNKTLENWTIPFILLLVSVGLTTTWFVLNSHEVGISVGLSIWNGVAQGVLIAMISDYFFNLKYQSTVKRIRVESRKI